LASGSRAGTAGAQRVNAPNSLVWNELQTHDVEPAIPLLQRGLWLGRSAGPKPGYVGLAVNDGRRQAGYSAVRREAAANTPSNWAVYFLVEDVAATVQRAAGPRRRDSRTRDGAGRTQQLRRASATRKALKRSQFMAKKSSKGSGKPIPKIEINLELSPEQGEELLKTLKDRFEKNMHRHEGLEWPKIQAKLEAHPEKLELSHEKSYCA
jgi:predicted enzyme related to lactoylglutathione lyase